MSNAKKVMQGGNSGVSTGWQNRLLLLLHGADNATAIDISDATNMSLSKLDDYCWPHGISSLISNETLQVF